jgi:hypothetical protein
MKKEPKLSNKNMQAKLNYKRAITTFILAYLAITILGTALSLTIGAIEHTPSTTEPLQNAAYVLSEKFLPLLNLLVWMSLSWVYFKKRTNILALRNEPLALGAFWLLVALPVDFIGFVVIKSPISLSPYDFYIGQFPWIYLIYIVVLISPLCYVTLARALSNKAVAYVE